MDKVYRQMINLFKKHSWLVTLLLVVLIYLGTHLIELTKLAVFADEAIYIRWSQLIVDDAKRYAFFSLNDGKTPLFIWLNVPLQYTNLDPLYAGRLISVFAGLGTIWLVVLLAQEYSLKPKWRLMVALLVMILPFWFFHHRMALMDSLMVFWLALTWLGLLKTIRQLSWVWTILTGLSFGLALLTKLPAVLFVPPLILVIIQSYLFKHILPSFSGFIKTLKSLIPHFLLMGLIGCSLFFLLKLNPAFGQLFSRGGDFLYKLPELTLWRILHNFWVNGLSFGEIFGRYLTWGGLALIGVGIFMPKQRRVIGLLILMAIAFMLPIQIMGKVIYARYLLPAALPLTLAVVLASESISDQIQKEKKLFKKIFLAVILAACLGQTVTQSTRFMLYSWLSPNQLDFTLSDKVQYLMEWSAGNGVKEVSDTALKVSQNQSLLILTEGYFGTLPDGVLLYLHHQKLQNLFVEGIGQPVREIPQKMIDKAANYDQVWLVVNSHRLALTLPPELLLGQYCRVPNSPCLQIWDLKTYLRNLPK